MDAVAIVVAAGSGERLGAGRPKAFVVCAGRTLLEWSLRAVRAAGLARVVVALPGEATVEGGSARVEDTAVALHGAQTVAGGATRSASVRRALAAAGSPRS